MYVPKHFEENREEEIKRIIEKFQIPGFYNSNELELLKPKFIFEFSFQ